MVWRGGKAEDIVFQKGSRCAPGAYTIINTKTNIQRSYTGRWTLESGLGRDPAHVVRYGLLMIGRSGLVRASSAIFNIIAGVTRIAITGQTIAVIHGIIDIFITN